MIDPPNPNDTLEKWQRHLKQVRAGAATTKGPIRQAYLLEIESAERIIAEKKAGKHSL